MAFTYDSLTDEERAAILDSRLAQYEREHFNHACNAAVAQAARLPAAERKAQVQASEEAMAQLESAITVTQAERTQLPTAEN